MTAQGWIGPASVAAVVAALVTVLGWVVTAWRERRRAEALRVERSRDVQTALAAEILPYVEVLELFDLSEALATTLRRMRADPAYRPVVPSERNDTLFRAIISDIHILPEPVIRPVVRYYSQLFALEAMIADLRSDLFTAMTPDQREAMLSDHVAMKQEALLRGRDALRAIDLSLGKADE